MSDFTDDLDDLETAEDFLRFFHVTVINRFTYVLLSWLFWSMKALGSAGLVL